MVSLNRRYRSPEKGYSRLGNKRDTDRILDEELSAEAMAVAKGLAPGPVEAPGAAAPARAGAAPPPSTAGGVVEPERAEPSRAGRPSEVPAIEAARQSIRTRVARYSEELDAVGSPARAPEPSARDRSEGGLLARLWRSVRSLLG